jgi:hypothetical protein
MNKIREIFDRFTFNKRGDNHFVANFGVSIGVVVDTDDPLQMGRLRVYCPELNDDPKKVQHLPWAAYVSPFGGSIRNSCHTKGHDKSNAISSGVTQYGFWAIPEKGAHVLITCVNGDPRKRVWLGCLYELQETGGFFHGVYDWGSGTSIEGPYSAPEPDFPEDDTKNPIQPLYNNLGEAFNGEKDSPEWKSRAADYPGMVNVNIDVAGTHGEMLGGEKDSWVKEKLGAAGYDWSGFKNLGAYLASRVIGFMSPGLHSISFDDRPFNSRIKLRTTAGHQIILDDTNERIYINTYQGKSWLEMDTAGNIDIFGERNISVRAKKDINFSTDETFRVKAAKGIYMYAGDTQGQTPLEEEGIPLNGQIRLHSSQDTHFLVEGNMFQTIHGNMDFTMDGTTNDGNFTGYIEGEVNLETNTDTFNILLPNHRIMINDNDFQIDTQTFIMYAEDKLQISAANNTAKFEMNVARITLDATTVAFNDFGTTVGTMVAGINVALACCPATPLFPIPQIIIMDILENPEFEVLPPHFAPWTNRVPDHEPWPRVMKIDSGDPQNQKSERPDYNVDWTDQYDKNNTSARRHIGIVEGEDEIKRGDFWRR